MNGDDIPKEVQAIATHWGGKGAPIRELRDGVWEFRCSDPEDGLIYLVFRPGTEFPVFEDSGRPSGAIIREDWAVRPIGDAPDGWFTVPTDGLYQAWNGNPVQLW